jgi:3-hydroxyisobutyrate dehydrogenase
MNETSPTRIAVLGLGTMGSAFARRAADAGLRVTAWDRNPERETALANERVQAARSAQEAARDADAVVTMVADAEAVLSVMHERDAFIAMKDGAAWVQMSTIGVEGTERAMRLAATRPEITFIDAPVSGSKGVAEQGKLVVLASGDRNRAGVAVQRFFETIAAQVHWLGKAGEGTRMKLLFNAWIGILIEDVAEVATLAHALEIDPRRFAELAQGGPLVPPWALQKLAKITEGRTTETEFALRWAEKDLRLALSAAGEARRRLPALNEIAMTWADALHDFGGDDISAVYLALQRR